MMLAFIRARIGKNDFVSNRNSITTMMMKKMMQISLEDDDYYLTRIKRFNKNTKSNTCHDLRAKRSIVSAANSNSNNQQVSPLLTEQERELLRKHLIKVRSKAEKQTTSQQSPQSRELLCAIEFREYDANKLAEHFRTKKLKVMKRMIEILYRSIACAAKVYFKVGSQEQRAIYFRKSLIELGPAFVKFGQVLSTRADVLPKVYCDVLSELQDQMPASDLSSAKKFLRDNLGCEPEDAFETFDPVPIAAASLAQVYKATLVGSSKMVAVKLQRPEAFERVALDSYVLRLVAEYSAKNPIKKFNSDVVRIVDELVGRIFEEMDYEREANQCNRFRETYQDGKIAGNVRAPMVINELSNQRVLTMEFVQGERIDNLQKLVSRKEDKHEILRRGVRCSLHQLLATGFMHADPHPGNLIVDENGSLVYLDFGTCVFVPKFQRRAMIRALIGFVNRDAESLVNDLKTLDFLPKEADDFECVGALTKVFAERGNRIKDSNDFMAVITQLTEALLHKGFRLPPTFARVLRALAALEGTAQAIDPNFKVLEQSYPYVLARVTSDRSPEMRQAVRRLLLDEKTGKVRWQRLKRLIEAYAEKGSEVSAEFSDRKDEESEDGEDYYLNDFDRARGVNRREKSRRENAFVNFRDFSCKSVKGVQTLVSDVFCSPSSSKKAAEEEETRKNGTNDDDDDENNEDEDEKPVSESPAVDAVNDALRFLFSKDGKIVRDNVVIDAIDAVETFLEDDFEKKIKRKDEGQQIDERREQQQQHSISIDQIITGVKMGFSATSDRPDLWIPTLGAYATRKESFEFVHDFALGAFDRSPKDLSELLRKLVHAATRRRSRGGRSTESADDIM
jgi:aarF domain-containing kinase